VKKDSKVRTERAQPLREALNKYSRASLLALLDAASCSPSASHKLPSIAVIFLELLKISDGSETAQASDLASLFEACSVTDPSLASVEDYLPADGRLDVRVRWGNRLLRLMPGSLERPVAMLERARLVANSADATLIEHLGFGLSDVCEMVLTRVDGACATMSPEWGVRPQHAGAPAVLSDGEVTRASQLPSMSVAVAKCSSPERAAKALEWATSDVPESVRDINESSFGTAVRIRNDDGLHVPVPIGFWIEALDSIINELAGFAAETDASIESRFHADSDAELARLLRRLQRPTRRNLPARGGGRIHSALAFDRNSVVAVDLSSTLSLVDTEDSKDRLERFEAKVEDIVRVHITSSSRHLVVFSMGGGERVVATTLDDVAWIVDRCLKEPDDFFLFFKELLEHPNVRQMVMLETINGFEHWRANGKCFFRQGGEYHFALLPLHLGEQEWIEAARRTPLEMALLKLGVSRAAKWDVARLNENQSDAIVGYFPAGPAWLVRVSSPVVGVHCFDGDSPAELRQLMLSIAQGVLWRIDKSVDVQKLIAEAIGEQALKLWFQPTSVDRAVPVFHFLGWDSGRLMLGFDERLQEYCGVHSSGVELVVGEALALGLSERGVDTVAFNRAWGNAPTGFQMNAAALPVGSNPLPAPEHFSEAMQSAARRTLATRLKEGSVETREYVGRDATQLETLTISPYLLEMLADAVAPFEAAAILDHALNQLERALCEGHVQKLRRGWDDQFPVRGYDSLKRHVSEERESSMLVRVIRVIAEEVLRRPPVGSRAPEHFDWLRVLSIADLFAQSGIRSEANHLGLVPVRTSISSMYDVEQDKAGEWLYDHDAFHEAKVVASATPPEESVTPEDLEPVAVAMFEGEGFRPEGIGLVLLTISAWDVAPIKAIGTCSVDELVEAAYESGVREVSKEEIRSAIDALTLRASDLSGEVLQHWEQERRTARLMTKPIVEAPDGRLRILPWQSNATWRVFQGYLMEGRCMWPAAGLSARLQKALEAFRERRTRDLERLVAREFRNVTPLVAPNVKKPKVLGLTTAEWDNVGEIDCVAVDATTKIVWVAEAKDLFIPFSPSTTRRSYQKYFEGDKAYVPKLLKKAAMIERNLAKVLLSFKCDCPPEEWRVRPVMVTRRVEPAGFARTAMVPFCHVDGLLALIRQ
jgi:hypothetical protein